LYPFIYIDALNLRIPLYGLMLALSMVSGYLFARRQMIRRLRLAQTTVDAFALALILGSLLGARIFSLVVERSVALREIPSYLFRFQSTGVTFYGGFIVALLVITLFVWKCDLSFWALADILTVPLIFGLALTRIGCFMAGCCWGRPTDMPWAVTFSNPESLTPLKHIPLHPTQLYHSSANFAIFLALLVVYYRYKCRSEGLVFTLFLILYPLGRFFTEFFRGMEGRRLVFDVFSTSQCISIVVFGLGMAKLWLLTRREGPL
jgi:phosphatidylglycerol:prolipoprotein diacylglycerol transferase